MYRIIKQRSIRISTQFLHNMGEYLVQWDAPVLAWSDACAQVLGKRSYKTMASIRKDAQNLGKQLGVEITVCDSISSN